METKKKALGKGLEELFSNSSFTIDTLEDTIVKEERNNATEIELSQIRSNPYQPRKVFDEEALNELADSIKVYGVVEPVILKKSVKGYEIVAGERRCKASKIAGLTTVPAIIKDFTDEEMMEIALLENIQREDLNPVDTAISISNILQVKDMTQEEFSKKFGKSRSYITNLLGLLNLPKSVQELVKNGKLSMSHARCLSKIDDEEKVINLANKIIKENLDNIMLNPWLAYPIFFIIMALIFQVTFSWIGQPLSDLLDSLLNDSLVPIIESLIQESSPWFQSLIIDGIIGGVGGILVLLPIILSLFACITILEDSGYMARVAFIMDKIMRKMGLSGKAFIPMIVGFGCSAPAIMSARTLESEKDRKLTALLVPLMSCNARLPVYSIFAAVFFPNSIGLVVASLYFLGILLAFILGIIFKHTIFKNEEEPLLIELPEYKLPSLKNLLNQLYEKTKGFLVKAGTLIFAMSIILWFLSNFNFSGMTDVNNSILSSIGGFIAPIFKPLGFGNWQASVSLLTGLIAKETVVSSMSVIFAGDLQLMLPLHFTALSALSFLVFVLLYTPCITVVGTMKKEFGSKLTLFSVAYQLILAWLVAFLVFNIGSLII